MRADCDDDERTLLRRYAAYRPRLWRYLFRQIDGEIAALVAMAEGNVW